MTNVGTTVFALKYKDGVMVAADTQVGYGSWLREKDFKRMTTCGDEAIFACSGEMSDYQNLKKHIDSKYEEDAIQGDGALFWHPKEYHNFIGGYQYQKRCKMDPTMVSAIVAGVNKTTGEAFLGLSDPWGLK
jgi:20S proteasome subunit beta 7